MSSISKLAKIRYKAPLDALGENALGKSVLSIGALTISMGTDIITTITAIFDTPVELVLLLMAAILCDWITGIASAKRNDTYIRSLGLRQTWLKCLEYAAGLIILSGIANVFGASDIQGWVGDLLRYMKNIHWLGYFYATFTEFKSIAENVQDKEGRFEEIIRKINNRFFGEKDDDMER